MNLPDITVMQWTMIWVKAAIGLVVAAFLASSPVLALLVLSALLGGAMV